jgi:hypothetical protein
MMLGGLGCKDGLPMELRQADTDVDPSVSHWAGRYGTGGLEMRSRALHEAWMKKLSCPVLRSEGERSVAEQLESITRA